MRKLDMKYTLFFPAKLRVIYKDRTHFFQAAREVWYWMETQGLHTQAEKGRQKDTGWWEPRKDNKKHKSPMRSPSTAQMHTEEEKLIREL